jgi:hypothetical protein
VRYGRGNTFEGTGGKQILLRGILSVNHLRGKRGKQSLPSLLLKKPPSRAAYSLSCNKTAQAGRRGWCRLRFANFKCMLVNKVAVHVILHCIVPRKSHPPDCHASILRFPSNRPRQSTMSLNSPSKETDKQKLAFHSHDGH